MRKAFVKMEMLLGNRASSFSLSPADSSYCLVNSEMTTDDVNEKEKMKGSIVANLLLQWESKNDQFEYKSKHGETAKHYVYKDGQFKVSP